MTGKQVMREEEETIFIRRIVDLAREEMLTISNVKELTSKACKYMEDNAMLLIRPK